MIHCYKGPRSQIFLLDNKHLVCRSGGIAAAGAQVWRLTQAIEPKVIITEGLFPPLHSDVSCTQLADDSEHILFHNSQTAATFCEMRYYGFCFASRHFRNFGVKIKPLVALALENRKSTPFTRLRPSRPQSFHGNQSHTNNVCKGSKAQSNEPLG